MTPSPSLVLTTSSGLAERVELSPRAREFFSFLLRRFCLSAARPRLGYQFSQDTAICASHPRDYLVSAINSPSIERYVPISAFKLILVTMPWLTDSSQLSIPLCSTAPRHLTTPRRRDSPKVRSHLRVQSSSRTHHLHLAALKTTPGQHPACRRNQSLKGTTHPPVQSSSWSHH